MSNITNINVKQCRNCAFVKKNEAGDMINGCMNIADCPQLSVKAKFDKIIEVFKSGDGYKRRAEA